MTPGRYPHPNDAGVATLLPMTRASLRSSQERWDRYPHPTDAGVADHDQRLLRSQRFHWIDACGSARRQIRRRDARREQHDTRAEQRAWIARRHAEKL